MQRACVNLCHMNTQRVQQQSKGKELLQHVWDADGSKYLRVVELLQLAASDSDAVWIVGGKQVQETFNWHQSTAE
nr:hypothetical protein L204_03439 [Cryptococcus depauperatus CBS 7855]